MSFYDLSFKQIRNNFFIQKNVGNKLIYNPIILLLHNETKLFTTVFSSQAAMFSAMLSGLSGESVNQMTSMSSVNTRSLLDCAAQAGHNQARNFGLASLASSNSGKLQLLQQQFMLLRIKSPVVLCLLKIQIEIRSAFVFCEF